MIQLHQIQAQKSFISFGDLAINREIKWYMCLCVIAVKSVAEFYVF